MAKLDLSLAPNEAVNAINNHDHSEIGAPIDSANITIAPTGLITKDNIKDAIIDLTSAENIGITPVVGLQATTVQSALVEIKNTIASGVNAYGIEWDSTRDIVTRIGLAKDQDRTLFDSVAPWSNIKRCNLRDDGVVLAYYGDPLYKDDGSYGQVMVEIPAFYYRKETLTFPSRNRWYISATPQTGFELHPAFISNGVTKEKIYMSAYEGFLNGTKLESKSGVQPTTNYTISQFRTYAQARGSGWQQQTFQAVSALQMLFSIEYASFDSQGCIGRGVVDKTDNGSTNMSVVTGGTNALGNISGMASGTNGLVSISYRGVENLWGNTWKFVDGINIKNYIPYVADNTFASDVFTGSYASLEQSMPTTNGYMSNCLTYSAGFLPSTITGSSTTKFYDQYYAPTSTGNFVVIFGGGWDNDGGSGVFGWDCNNGSSYANRYISSRLLYLG